MLTEFRLQSKVAATNKYNLSFQDGRGRGDGRLSGLNRFFTTTVETIVACRRPWSARRFAAAGDGRGHE
jgi:hypothetical protein